MEIKQIQIIVARADMFIVSALHTLRWLVPLAAAVVAALCAWHAIRRYNRNER